MNATTLKLFATAVIWGGTFIAGRLLGPELGPFSAAFLRFVAASVFLYAALALREGGCPRIAPGLLPALVGLGATGVFAYNYCFFEGLKTVPASRAALIVAANPVGIALLARLCFNERLTPSKIAGITVCLCGAAVVISHGDPSALLAGRVGSGELVIVGCVASWSAYSVLGKFVMGRLTPLASVTFSCLIGAALLLPFALAEGLPRQAAALSWTGWASVAYLGVLGTGLGFVWFYQGIQAIGASRAGVFINFVPVSAALMGTLLLGEPLEASLFAGGALVLCGVALTNRRTS